MNPLRIVQFNSVFNGGGTDGQTLDLAAGLHDCGDDVTLAIARGSRWEPLASKLGVRVELIPAKGKLGIIRGLARVLNRQRAQVVHAHQGRDYWPAILAARLAGVGTRVVITRHLMTRPRAFSRLFLLRAADVIAVSRAVEGVLQRELSGPRERLHQIYGGIDTSAFQPSRSAASAALRREQGWNEDDVVFGVVGAYSLPRGKGQLEFLQAGAQLTKEFPRARFVMIGRGSLESLLRAEIQQLGLGDVARLLPFTDDVATAMGALDVLVHPALGTEALGLVLWEALACGKPVIASRLDGIPEAFTEGEHGLLVPPADVPALASAMRTLLGDPALRKRLGAAGRGHVCRNFSRAAHAERTRALYSKLCLA